jgi:hypothetical protein
VIELNTLIVDWNLTNSIELDNIPADEEDATLLQTVGNVLFFQRFVVVELKSNAVLVVLLVGELESFSVFEEFWEGNSDDFYSLPSIISLPLYRANTRCL